MTSGGSAFRSHHVAISVRDLTATLEFYANFGFEPVFRMDDVDVSIVHLARPDGLMLEVFRYPENGSMPRAQLAAGNDIERVGVKHFAFHVPDLVAVRNELADGGLDVTGIRRGRTEVDFFFVADPDGMWVEIVQDDRGLVQSPLATSAAKVETQSDRKRKP